MYCILFDKNTGGVYMRPAEMLFYVYSDPSMCVSKPMGARLVETEYESEVQIKTVMWQHGFFRGFIDDKPVIIRNTEILSFKRDANDILYCQYVLTGNREYLFNMKKDALYTLCRIDGTEIYFPAVEKDDKCYVLSYTDKDRMSRDLYAKYPDYKLVRVGFKSHFMINDTVYD